MTRKRFVKKNDGSRLEPFRRVLLARASEVAHE